MQRRGGQPTATTEQLWEEPAVRLRPPEDAPPATPSGIFNMSHRKGRWDGLSLPAFSRNFRSMLVGVCGKTQ